jgi:hypothetical protein
MYRHFLAKHIRAVAAGATLAASLAAHAQSTTCAPPTLAQCQDHTYLTTDCGKLQTGANSQCAALIKPAADAAYAAKQASLQPRIDPVTNTVKMTKVETYSDPSLVASGNTAIFAGQTVAAQASSVKPVVAATSASTTTSGTIAARTAVGSIAGKNIGVIQIDPKTLWSWNGAVVGSCDEYAYEKYYDYSVFEDLAVTHGTDYRAIFNLAYDPTVGVANKFLRSKSGGPINLQVWYPYGSGDIEFGGTTKSPKNDYYAGYARAKYSGFALNDAATQAIFDAGQTYWDPEGWTWMTARSNELASFPDDQLDALNKKQEEFNKLVDDRIAAATAYKSSATADRLATLNAIDQQLRDAITQAKTDGCIDNTKTTQCDWAPRQFWKRFQSFFQKQREHDYQRCVNDTGSNFTVAKAANGIGAPMQSGSYDYTRTSELMDSFLGLYETYAAHQPMMTDPATGNVVMGQKAGDSGNFGNSDFGVKYGWDASWSVSGFEGFGKTCNAKSKALVDAYTDGTVFGSTYHVFKAQATADSTASTAAKLAFDVFMNDSNVYHAEKTVGPYHLAVNPSKSYGWSGSYSFPVLGIPVTIAGGINAAAGLDATLDVTTNSACGTNQSITLAEAKGYAKPWIKADAFASASVDVVIASGGVKLTLTLLKLNLPFNGDFKVYMQPNYTAGATEGTILVDATGTLDLDLNTLDGKFSLFVDAFWGAWSDETTLLSWDGFHYADRLLSVGRIGIPLAMVKQTYDQQHPLTVGGILLGGTVVTATTLSAN